ERLDRLDTDRISHEMQRVHSHEDLTVLRRLLETLRRVHCVAGHECVPESRVAGDDLAGVDPDSRLESHAAFALEPLVEHGEGEPHLRRRANRTYAVVLVHDRMTEDGHDRVADELLHRSAVSLEDP